MALDYRIVARRKVTNVRLADKSHVWQNLRLTRQRIEQNRPNLAKYTALAAKSNKRKPLGHVRRS